jgi:hypothetical protein
MEGYQIINNRTTSKTRNILENAKCKKFLEQEKVENVI